MGGKSYFCDYCRCYMKNDKNVRKTHSGGLQHRIIKTSIMRKYEDPRKLYEEEINKKPCPRYFKGYCKYDLYCELTHFNETQLKELQRIVENLNIKAKTNMSNTPNSKTTESFKLPWQNSISKRNLKLLPLKLPSSLKAININRLSKLDVKLNKWGVI